MYWYRNSGREWQGVGWVGWGGMWGKQLTARAQVVVHGCTQLSCLCTLPKKCFYWVHLKTQSEIHWHTCVRTTKHAHTRAQKNTNKQTDWKRGNSIHPTVCLRHYPHSKPDTQYFSLCCDNSVPVSVFCEQNSWQTNKNKILHQELHFSKNLMNISNLPLFYDILVHADLCPPATGSTWNVWWSWSAWTCWREGQHFPLATTQRVPLHIQ